MISKLLTEWMCEIYYNKYYTIMHITDKCVDDDGMKTTYNGFIFTNFSTRCVFRSFVLF